MEKEGSPRPLLTAAYEQLLHILFALFPLAAIAYLHLFQDPNLRFESHGFHEIAISVAIVESAFITCVTWYCYRDSGERLLQWLTLAFLGFTVIYAPHGAFTGVAHHNPMLFLLYGPASRLVMNACLLVGVLSHGKQAVPVAARGQWRLWAKWAGGFLAADVLIAALALSPIGPAPWLRLSMEWSAFVLAFAGVLIMLQRRQGLPLLMIYTFSLAFVAESSLAFIVAKPWNHLWWLAHAVSAYGFLLLSYGVIRAFHTTRSFASVYSQEGIMRRLEEARSQAVQAMNQLQIANQELARMAATDSLTGVSNRRHFLERLEAEIARTRRADYGLSILAIDLDHFKSINDRHGHQAGDEVLKKVVAAITNTLRTSDLLGRMGGEEFAVLLPETAQGEAAIIAERIRREIEALGIRFEDQQLHVTTSIGIAQYGRDGDMPNSLLATADRRLYEAKASGRNCTVGLSPEAAEHF